MPAEKDNSLATKPQTVTNDSVAAPTPASPASPSPSANAVGSTPASPQGFATGFGSAYVPPPKAAPPKTEA